MDCWNNASQVYPSVPAKINLGGDLILKLQILWTSFLHCRDLHPVWHQFSTAEAVQYWGGCSVLQGSEQPPQYRCYLSAVLMLSPHSTDAIPRSTEQPLQYWCYPPHVLMLSPCSTEQPPQYWTDVIRGGLVLLWPVPKRPVYTINFFIDLSNWKRLYFVELINLEIALNDGSLINKKLIIQTERGLLLWSNWGIYKAM